MVWAQGAGEVTGTPAQGSAWVERRFEQRLFALLRIGKLLVDDRQTVCRIRNMSCNGFMADTCPGPRAGQPLLLELCEGVRLSAVVAWSQWDQFGAEFASPQNLDELLTRAGSGARHRPRAVRIEPKEAYATLAWGGSEIKRFDRQHLADRHGDPRYRIGAPAVPSRRAAG